MFNAIEGTQFSEPRVKFIFRKFLYDNCFFVARSMLTFYLSDKPMKNFDIVKFDMSSLNYPVFVQFYSIQKGDPDEEDDKTRYKNRSINLHVYFTVVNLLNEYVQSVIVLAMVLRFVCHQLRLDCGEMSISVGELVISTSKDSLTKRVIKEYQEYRNGQYSSTTERYVRFDKICDLSKDLFQGDVWALLEGVRSCFVRQGEITDDLKQNEKIVFSSR
jgi:hypothetical protein